jgi:hypothetical protein
MLYRWLAIVVLGLHFCYMAYLLVGGYFAWRWPRTLFIHVLAAGWAVLIVTLRLECPLTSLQNSLRTRGEQPRLTGGFLDTYLRGVFYPAGHLGAAQILVSLVITLSWVGVVAKAWQRRCAPGSFASQP